MLVSSVQTALDLSTDGLYAEGTVAMLILLKYRCMWIMWCNEQTPMLLKQEEWAQDVLVNGVEDACSCQYNTASVTHGGPAAKHTSNGSSSVYGFDTAQLPPQINAHM
jgi:hypothetical protein